MRVWRICRRQHLATAFSGEGARFATGRWNSQGTLIAYSTEHLSLAALEVFVHVSLAEQPTDLVAVQAEVPVDINQLQGQSDQLLKKLPSDWRFKPEHSRELGDRWWKSRNSALLMVPSVIIDVEWNILINPAHPDASRLTILQSRDFRFDERMFKQHDQPR